MTDDNLLKVVDEFADQLDPDEIEDKASMLGIKPQELLENIKVEVLARLGL